MDLVECLKERITLNEDYLYSLCNTHVEGMTLNDIRENLKNIEKTEKNLHFDRKTLDLLQKKQDFC